MTVKPGLSMAHLSLVADQAGFLPVEFAVKWNLSGFKN
jgi:hypothetical protein